MSAATKRPEARKPSPVAAQAAALAKRTPGKTTWIVHWQRSPARGKHASEWQAGEFPTFGAATTFVTRLEHPDRLILVTIARVEEIPDIALYTASASAWKKPRHD